jgi:hypothetical protein
MEQRLQCPLFGGVLGHPHPEEGRWCGAIFKEYIRKEPACFSGGMPTSMKREFDFVNVTGIVFNTITDNLIDREYEINVFTAVAA